MIATYGTRVLVCFLLITINAFSKGLCFPKSTPLSLVKNRITPFILETDKVSFKPGSNCLEIYSSEQRMELLEKLIRKDFAVSETYGGFTAITKSKSFKHCEFIFEEEIKGLGRSNESKVGKKINISRTDSRLQGTKRMGLMTLPNKFSALQVGERTIFMKCRPRRGGYEVEFSFTDNDSGLSSQVYLAKGQRLNVGGIVKNLDDKTKEFGIPKGIDYSKRIGQSSSEYYLSIK